MWHKWWPLAGADRLPLLEISQLQSQNQESVRIQCQRKDPGMVFTRIMGVGQDNTSMAKNTLLRDLLTEGNRGAQRCMAELGGQTMQFHLVRNPVSSTGRLTDVLPFLSQSDVSTGSLGNWHQSLAEERQWVLSLQVDPHSIILGILDDFSLDSW